MVKQNFGFACRVKIWPLFSTTLFLIDVVSKLSSNVYLAANSFSVSKLTDQNMIHSQTWYLLIFPIKFVNDDLWKVYSLFVDVIRQVLLSPPLTSALHMTRIFLLVSQTTRYHSALSLTMNRRSLSLPSLMRYGDHLHPYRIIIAFTSFLLTLHTATKFELFF